jgi:hypothetical protein
MLYSLQGEIEEVYDLESSRSFSVFFHIMMTLEELADFYLIELVSTKVCLLVPGKELVQN